MNSTRTRTAFLFAVAVLVPAMAFAQLPGIRRSDLTRNPLSVPNLEAIQVLVEFAPGAIVPKHSHHGEELVYVVKGELEYQLEGRPPVRLKAGEALFIPDGTPHAVKNIGRGNAAELATYVVRKGEPLLVLAKKPAGIRPN